MRETFSTSEVAKRLGVSLRTIRFYDQRGLVSPHRGESLHRRYGTDDLRRLKFVIDARRLRFTLGEIALVLGAVSPNRAPRFSVSSMTRHRAMLASERAALDSVIEELDAALALRTSKRTPSRTPAGSKPAPSTPAEPFAARRFGEDESAKVGSAAA